MSVQNSNVVFENIAMLHDQSVEMRKIASSCETQLREGHPLEASALAKISARFSKTTKDAANRYNSTSKQLNAQAQPLKDALNDDVRRSSNNTWDMRNRYGVVKERTISDGNSLKEAIYNDIKEGEQNIIKVISDHLIHPQDILQHAQGKQKPALFETCQRLFDTSNRARFSERYLKSPCKEDAKNQFFTASPTIADECALLAPRIQYMKNSDCSIM